MVFYKVNENLDYSQIAGDTFFKYALQQDNDRSEYCRKKLIKYIFGIDVSSTKVMNPVNLRDSVDDKEMILHVHAMINDTYHVDLEMQQSCFYAANSRRFQAYSFEMVLAQAKKGDLMYDFLKPVYSGIFIDDDIGVTGLVAHYGMYEKDEYTLLKDNLHFLNIIQMKKINDIAKERELNEFEKLVYIFKNGPKGVKILPEERLVTTIMELYEDFTEDEPIWSISRNRERARRQQREIMAEINEEKDKAIKAKDEAIKAKDEAIKVKDEAIKVKDEAIKVKDEAIKVKDEAIKVKDEAIKKTNIAIKLLASNGVSKEDIAANLGMSIEQVNELLK